MDGVSEYQYQCSFLATLISVRATLDKMEGHAPHNPEMGLLLKNNIEILDHRQGTYGSRARYRSFQDCIWLFRSQINLALKSSEYPKNGFPKLTLVSSSGSTLLDRALAKSVSTQTILRCHLTPISSCMAFMEIHSKV